ncbi:MAG: HlyD family efflux transporter periplasmic adaptor subunit [Symploca sp. SIO3C6]|nr:HlyD family efflux transporter periplasmic adaptor subunit [Symploca sp. SIO3C6]
MVSDANPEFLQPAEPEEFLPPIGQWATLGGLVLLVGFSAAITLASVLKYKVTVKAPATVRPAGELRIVQATREGTVKSIAVKENQLVKQGDAIAYIDDSRLQTKKNQLQTNIRQNQRQLAQIDAQIRTVDEQVAAEGNRIRRTIASAQAELISIQRDYQDKQITTQAQVKEAEAALELASEELTRYQKLANTGAIAQLQIKEREAALKTATARLQRVKTALNPSAAPITAAKEQIAREQAAGEAALATLRREREMLTQRSIEVQNQIERDRQELQQIETELTHTIIAAPTDGTIFQLNLRNQGQFLRPTDTVAQIAPNHNFLVIKSLVQTQERDKIAVGEEVEMRVEACPYPNFGTLKGTVTEISADAITPVTASNGAAAYEVTIEPASLSLKFGEHECNLQPGMEGRADILAREETILTFILRQARLLTDF